MVSRSDAEPRPLPSAYTPVLVGSSALFDGYLSLFFSGCFDRMDRINRKPCEVGFQAWISPFLKVFGCGVFNAKNAKVLTQRGRKDFASFASTFFASFALKQPSPEIQSILLIPLCGAVKKVDMSFLFRGGKM